MSIKGVLITLENDPDRAKEAISILQERRGIEVGEIKEQWLPLTIETSSESECREVFRWIESLEGVYFVDTVFSSVEGPEADQENLENPYPEKEN